MSADLRVRWHLELVDTASSKVLRQDRAIRKSLTDTDKAQAKLAKTATQTGQAQVRGATQTASALLREGRAATTTQRDVEHLNRAQAQALSAGSRLAGSAQRVANAYRAQAGAARQLTAAERAREAASRSASRIASGAQGTGAGLTRGTQAALGAAAGGGIVAKSVATFAGFEQQMDRVLAVSGATRTEFTELNKLAQRLGADTSFSARQAADGMYQLSTAGFTAKETMRAIPGTLDLAAASGVDLASAAELQATTLRGFGLQAKDAGRVADVLAVTVNRSAVEMFDLGDSLKYIAPVARATGQSMDSMLAALGLMGNVGVKGSQAGTTLRTALVRLTAPTDKSAKALRELGIEAGELRGPKGLLPLPEILARIVKGAQGVDKGTRNAAIASIFGREALSGMIAMIDAGPAALERNIKALERSEGAAKRTAKTMRDNVAGGWDAFTGSLETAAITLTERFGPALKNALRGGAAGINDAARFLGDVAEGGQRQAAGRPLTDRVRGRAPRSERAADNAAKRANADVSTARKIGAALSSITGTIVRGAKTAGAQLLDAFKPALPFFQNVLLPLLEGVGRGVLLSIVGAFKVVIPIIKVVATVLGFVGRAAKPLSPILRGVGTVIGAIFAGGILTKAVAALGKLGLVGRAVGLGFRLLLLPIRVLGGLLGGLAGIAGRAASRLLGAFGKIVAPVRAVGSRIANGILSFVTGLPGRIGNAATKLAQAFVTLGGKLVSAVVRGIKAAPGAIVGAITELIPKPLRTVAGKVLGFLGGRSGGRLDGVRGFIRRQAGGLIPAAVSPGERVDYGGASWMVPGAPVAADSVRTLLPAGAVVWTGHGQDLLASGMAPADALAAQLPHFRAGGRVGASMYGGPRDTTTRKPERGYRGDVLERKPMSYAELGMGKALGGLPYEHPLRISYRGKSITARKRDIGRGGGQVDGHARAIDLYYRVAARLGFKGLGIVSVSGTRGPDSTDDVASRTFREDVFAKVSRTRRGVLTDAFDQGRTAGQEGLSRAEIRAAARGARGARANPLIAAIRGAQSATVRERTLPGDDGGAGGGTPRMQAMARFASRAGAKFPRYVYGGGHGSFAGPYDCSGYVSAILHAGGFLSRPIDTTGLKTWGAAGAGKRITVGVRGSSGKRAHTMLKVGTSYWESANSRGPTGRRSGWSGSFPIKRHPRGYRRGGKVGRQTVPLASLPAPIAARILRDPTALIPGTANYVGEGLRAGGVVGFRTGGTTLAPAGVGAQLRRVVTRAAGAGAALTAVDEAIGRAVEGRLRLLRDALERAVRRGGSKRTVQRLQGILDLIDGELGRRVGVLERRVDRRTAATARGRGQFDRDLRRRGLETDSAAGIAATALQGRIEENAARANVADLRAALGRARRAGASRPVLLELQEKLGAAQDELDEVLVTQVERARAFIRTQAQESVDRASFGLDVAQGGLSGLEAAQRVNRSGDTPAGMRERANAISSERIPALEELQRAQGSQLAAALATGDVAGARSATLAIQSTGTDLANAIADVGDLIRDAAQRAAQDLVDVAAHGTTLASAGLQRLELEQRIAGTFDSGGAQRSAFITTTLIPALQAELGAIVEQQRVAREQGLAAELRAAIEAEAAKRNELLQAQLDAQEELVAQGAQRRFGGTLGFSYAGETLTDALIAAGNGI